MPAALYQPIYLMILTMLCLVLGQRYVSSQGYEMQESGAGSRLPLLLSLFFVLWLGNRPLSGAYFGDTPTYAFVYALDDGSMGNLDWRGEWMWSLLQGCCKAIGLGVSAFFTIVESGYIIFVLWAIKRLMPDNIMLGLMFVIASLTFYAYGVNGLRNGLACHMVILGISFLADKRYLPCALLFFAALGIHRSVMLPIAASVVGAFFLKNPKYAIYFWLASIFISLAAGENITELIASLGFDDRMSSYSDATNDVSGFSHTGFRWDFLIYSAMPILMVWYICVRRKVSDTWYDLIATVYCLCNAFWIMVIRSSFSNRFAYLSWFIYPIVIAYPLANLAVWDDQDKKIGLILLLYCGFTVFMQAVYW